MADWLWIAPYTFPPSRCLSVGGAPSQGIVYAINEQIVLKIPYQYRIPKVLDDTAPFRRDDGLRSFELLRKEAKFYQILNESPHPNIVRCLYSDQTNLFLERAAFSLEQIPPRTGRDLRQSWIRQLLDALCWLECLGYTHGDLNVRNIGVDNNGCLKLFDFSEVTSESQVSFKHAREKDHWGLASCLHFILSQIEPLADVRSLEELRQIEEQMKHGSYPIHPDAIIMKDLIRDGWAGRNVDKSFVQIRIAVEKFNRGGEPAKPTYMDYDVLGQACRDWLKDAVPTPDWMVEDEYRAMWKSLGYDVEKGIWVNN